ncbi:aldolase [Teratosphaeria nubilosa]|uniref:Aldolase n=1 Tax=Teratosphaeria nubilosa TaxID=161662 RepID=A0A6G1KXY4_9PEZI|nr:aldolase [Teratosphaeria nubilosa]
MAIPDRTNGSAAKSSPPPPGIYVPVPTFFAQEGASGYDPVTPPLDTKTQSEHSLFLVRGGIKGLVILGSTGEAIFLRSKERNELISSQRKALDDAGFKDRPIIAGTATQQIDDTLELIEESKHAGAEYTMVLGPGYFAPSTSQQGIQKWFEAVADKSVLPVLIYHYPGVTNNLYIAPSTFEKLAAHPNIVGTKLSHGIIDDQTLIAASPNIDHSHFYVFTGLGQNLLPVLTIGGVAAIDGLAGVFPRIVVRLFNMFNEAAEKGITKKDLAEFQKLQFRICEGEKLIARWGVVGVKEAIARVWGMGSRTGGRLPLAGGFEEGEVEWKKWDKVFQGLKELEDQFKAEGKEG